MRKSEELTADVAVVGGGVAGLSVARACARRGLSVVLVEGERAVAEASRAAAGMLAPQSEADGADDFFRLLCASRDMYPAFAEELFNESGVCIELDTTGTLYLALTEEDAVEVERRFDWQTRAGLAVERLTAREARALEPNVSTRVVVALRFPRDWQVENRLLVSALASSLTALGARTLKGARAEGLRVSGGRSTGVETSEGFVSAGAVVVAAGAQTSRVPLLFSEREEMRARVSFDEHPRIEPVRGQMLCFRQTDAGDRVVRHVVYSKRGYIVPRRDGRLLAGATTESVGFDCRVTAEGVDALRRNAEEIAPAVSRLALADSWAGLRPRAADDWPVLGESAEVKRLFYATGYYRNGILLAPATAEILADSITGGCASTLSANALSTFSPARFRRALAEARAN